MNPPKDKDKKGKEKTKCTYFHKGWHPERSCMKNTIDTMARLLEKNNILVPDSTRKMDGTSSSNESKEKCHALVAGTSNYSYFSIDLGSYRNKVAKREIFSSMSLNVGPAVRMGGDSEL